MAAKKTALQKAAEMLVAAIAEEGIERQQKQQVLLDALAPQDSAEPKADGKGTG
jgi:hypothetical protein